MHLKTWNKMLRINQINFYTKAWLNMLWLKIYIPTKRGQKCCVQKNYLYTYIYISTTILHSQSMKISCPHVSFQGFFLLYHGSDLWSHIHFEAFNAFAEISFSALDLAAPNIPIFTSVLLNDWSANPLQSTSMGS